MVLLRVALIAFLLPSFVFATDVPRRVFLLAKPSVQTMERGVAWTAVPLTMDLAYGSGATFVYYQATGEPFSTAAMALYQLGTGATGVKGMVDWGTSKWFDLNRRKELEEIAKTPGVQKIRALTATHTERMGFMSSRLESSTFYFVEVAGDEVPKEFKGAQWLPVDDLAGTKLRLNLKLEGHYKVAPAEISLQQLFDGHPLDAETERIWKAAIGEWTHKQPLMDRYVTHKSINGMRIEASLVRGEEVLDLGNWATGRGVLSQIGDTWFQNLKRFLAVNVRGKTEDEARKLIRARETEVLAKGSCSSWYRRLRGREVLAP